ncbi:MAG: dodecin family protein [Bacteroidota bacterium]|nr:dodecin family protein [Bacteroidota bacterium]
MALLKVIELLAESKKSWEDAAQNAVTEASKSIHNIRSVYVQDLSAEVDKKGKIIHWRLNCKISFEKDEK